MISDARQLLADFQQAMLDFSPDALADLFAIDAVYEFPLLAPQREAQRYRGREAIRAGFRRSWSTAPASPVVGFPEVRVHDTADPAVIVAEHQMEVRRAGAGNFTANFLLVLTARDGQIVHLRDYADVLGVARGLGRLPQLLDALRDDDPAYVLSEVVPREPAALERYRSLAAESIARHGGRYLVRAGAIDVAEGDWPSDTSVVLVEFPSRTALDQWYASEDYAIALEQRRTGLDRRLLFLSAAPSDGRT